MTDADAILVRVLALQDAYRLPVRDWSGFSPVNRYHAARAGAVPFRISTQTEAGRKATERELQDLAAAKLLTVSRGPRVKFPLVALLPAGEAQARELCGLPGLYVGRLFLDAVIRRKTKFLNGWVPEVQFTGGRGWGDRATPADRRLLADVELDALPAISAGWVVANSSRPGHACYAATPAGIAAAKVKPGGEPKAVAADAEAKEMYRVWQDVRLTEMHTHPPADAREIGPLPLVASEVGQLAR